jgi:antitoxin component YwqK of YwqJK toxin-antitoxin module
MRTIFIIFFALSLAKASYCQELTFIKDSIMDNYMKSGYSNSHFNAAGKTDKNHLRQGYWKDYIVINDFEYVNIDNKSQEIFGNFLLYGEGKFIDGKREGPWKFYVIEDKTLRKILHQEVSFLNGEKVGPSKCFFPDGNISVAGTYVSDQLDGEIKSFYDNGKLYGTRPYSKGKRIGKHIYFYSNGAIQFELNFVNDTLNGLYQAYYQNGKIQESFYYKMDNINGDYKYYYDNGQLWIEKEYENGLLMNVIGNYDKEGKARDKGTLKDGNGTVNYYTEAGSIYSILTFRDGTKVAEESK